MTRGSKANTKWWSISVSKYSTSFSDIITELQVSLAANGQDENRRQLENVASAVLEESLKSDYRLNFLWQN